MLVIESTERGEILVIVRYEKKLVGPISIM